ncbi:hypothetical protein [Cellulomonas cellasea]|uniref:Uncharacterized protein n=1 Tax=Cellulomonas cellasea TaxID=43670 RepID=A0A7W4UG34_9CELL|nr:hypothetical protein [Cellulomonas cellasea]MBB2923492.1 hypothetical protein [Cellulomonas cellasea]
MAPDDASDEPLDLAESLAIIQAQRARVRDQVAPDPRVLFGAWGVAWLVGYLVLWSSARGEPYGHPGRAAFTVFGVLLSAALAATIAHIARRTAGVRGASERAGSMYGWTWTIGFSAVVLTMIGLTRAGAGWEVLALGWNALSALVVGVLYAAGAAMWEDWRMFGLGAWIALVAGATTLLGVPGSYLLMALAGGGGMLAAATLAHVSRRKGGW